MFLLLPCSHAMYSPSKHLKGQDPRVSDVTFLDQRRSVGLVFQGGFMVFHGFRLVSMVFQGGSMVFMVFGRFPWFFKVV